MVYVDELLSSLAAAVPQVPTIVITDGEGYLLRPPNNCAAAWRALEAAAGSRDWLLFLEDDVRPTVPFLWALTHPLPAGAAFASLCRAFRQPPGMRPATLFMGSQAVLFAAETVQRLVDLRRNRPEVIASMVSFDIAVAVAGQMLGMTYEQGPEYFNHVGTVSAASPRP